jgi:hypothetical protein
MKLVEMQTEHELEEAFGQPMGMLSTAANKIGAAFGSQAAAGRLQGGQQANTVMNQIKQWAGQTGVKNFKLDDVMKGKLMVPLISTPQGLTVLKAMLANPQWDHSRSMPLVVGSKEFGTFILNFVQQMALGVGKPGQPAAQASPNLKQILKLAQGMTPQQKAQLVAALNPKQTP